MTIFVTDLLICSTLTHIVLLQNLNDLPPELTFIILNIAAGGSTARLEEYRKVCKKWSDISWSLRSKVVKERLSGRW